MWPTPSHHMHLFPAAGRRSRAGSPPSLRACAIWRSFIALVSSSSAAPPVEPLITPVAAEPDSSHSRVCGEEKEIKEKGSSRNPAALRPRPNMIPTQSLLLSFYSPRRERRYNRLHHFILCPFWTINTRYLGYSHRPTYTLNMYNHKNLSPLPTRSIDCKSKKDGVFSLVQTTVWNAPNFDANPQR